MDESEIENEDKWQWEMIGQCYATIQRTNPSACLISNIDKESMMVCGGYHAQQYLECVHQYDFSDNKWKGLNDLNIKRCEAGIYNDQKITNKIYIAGGDSIGGALHDVEYYDLHKNKWYFCKPTRLQHENYPKLWRQNQLLCIMSVGTFSNGFEWIDLRENKTWKVIYFPGTKRSLSSLFGQNVPVDNVNVNAYRFIK